MARIHSLLALLVVAAMLLAGCTGGGSGDGDDTSGSDSSDRRDGSEGSSVDPIGATGDSKPRRGQDIAQPHEQKQARCQDVDTPAEWCERDWTPKSQRKFAAPIWKKGYEWRYSMSVPIAAGKPGYCDREHVNAITGTGRSQDLNTFLLKQTQFDCEDKVVRDVDKNYTRADLMQLRDDGYIEHEMVFPLEDGKRWFYHRDGDVTVEAKMEFVPNYRWGDSLLGINAWKITLQYSEGGIVLYKWFGEAQQNYVYEEVWADLPDQGHVLVATINLIDHDVS